MLGIGDWGLGLTGSDGRYHGKKDDENSKEIISPAVYKRLKLLCYPLSRSDKRCKTDKGEYQKSGQGNARKEAEYLGIDRCKGDPGHDKRIHAPYPVPE